MSDFSDPRHPQTQRYPAGQQPYDGLVTPDGRHYLAGLFGEDGVALLDTWQPEQGTRRILHMEFTPRGEAVWLSARDDNRVVIYDTATFERVGEFPAQAPSGIFFTSRGNRTGF